MFVMSVSLCVMIQGGGALQSVSHTMPDFDLRLLQNVIYVMNNML
jgi:hypothetical protein